MEVGEASLPSAESKAEPVAEGLLDWSSRVSEPSSGPKDSKGCKGIPREGNWGSSLTMPSNRFMSVSSGMPANFDGSINVDGGDAAFSFDLFDLLMSSFDAILFLGAKGFVKVSSPSIELFLTSEPVAFG